MESWQRDASKSPNDGGVVHLGILEDCFDAQVATRSERKHAKHRRLWAGYAANQFREGLKLRRLLEKWNATTEGSAGHRPERGPGMLSFAVVAVHCFLLGLGVLRLRSRLRVGSSQSFFRSSVPAACRRSLSPGWSNLVVSARFVSPSRALMDSDEERRFASYRIRRSTDGQAFLWRRLGVPAFLAWSCWAHRCAFPQERFRRNPF